jgi:hypothetical protein
MGRISVRCDLLGTGSPGCCCSAMPIRVSAGATSLPQRLVVVLRRRGKGLIVTAATPSPKVAAIAPSMDGRSERLLHPARASDDLQTRILESARTRPFSPSTSNRKARLGVEAALGGAKVPVSPLTRGREGQGALPPDGKARVMKVEAAVARTVHPVENVRG